MKKPLVPLATLALTALTMPLATAASLAVSPDLTVTTTGSDPGEILNSGAIADVINDFPELADPTIRFQNVTAQGVEDITFTVDSGSAVTSINQFIIFGLQSNLVLTAATAADGATPVTFSILSSPAPSELSIVGSGAVGDTIAGSEGTAGPTRFTGSGGNNQQGIGIVQFNTEVTSFTLQDVQPLPGAAATSNVFDNVFVTFAVPTAPVPEPSSALLLGLSGLVLCTRRKRNR